MQLIPLGQIQPSPTNPRCHFDQGDLLDLAARELTTGKPADESEVSS